MSQTGPSAAQTQTRWRLGTTTMSRRRGDVIVSIEGVPTYQDGADGEAMIPGPLAVTLDDAMLAMLDEIEQSNAKLSSERIAG